MSDGRPRLFVAVVPPAEVLDELDRLPRPDEAGVRWTRRDQWHVTLRFLGQCDPDAATAALTGITAAEVGAARPVARCGPQVSRLGRSVVCVPVAGLDGLAAAVVARTATIGEPPDPRPFTGHLTLARLARRGACRLAGHRVDATFAIDEIVLVRSRLRADGADHETLARFGLGDPT